MKSSVFCRFISGFRFGFLDSIEDLMGIIIFFLE